MGKKAYFFRPQSPLVLRTGRPFDQAGNPVSLAFPLPSTLAGCCRTSYADSQGKSGWNFAEKKDDLLAIPVRGPLAAAMTGGKLQVFFPRPADGLYFQVPEEEPVIIRLKPGELANGEKAYLPHADLLPVFSDQHIKAKQVPGDSWWSEEHIGRWLAGDNLAGIQPQALGWDGPQTDIRTHVALDPKSFAAETGMLFQTEGLSFAQGRRDPVNHKGWKDQYYGILARMPGKTMNAVSCRLGGEGRICGISCLDGGWPELPGTVKDGFKKPAGIRLVLATPALFDAGWKPGWLDKDLVGSPPGFPGIKLKLRAFTAPRWEPVSGWDLQAGKPREIRRMVPAGAVYWFDVLEGWDRLEQLWLQPVSDRQQDQRDGYGLVLPGLWDKER